MKNMDDFQARRRMNELKKDVGREAREQKQATRDSSTPPPGLASRAWRMVKIVCMTLLFAILAFFVGRYSYTPAIAQYLPKLPGIGIVSNLPAPPPAADAPMQSAEDYLYEYIRLVQTGNVEELAPYEDPAYPTDNEVLTRETVERRAKELETLESYKIHDVKKTASFEVIFRKTDGETQHSTIQLTFQYNRWTARNYWF